MPELVAYSEGLFEELGLSPSLVEDEGFQALFSGDMSVARESMKPYGWATGYALSIYGTEYTQQCPFQTGNGYGDGRAISVFEGVFKGARWELQLKGAGRTPYCRGADGRAVLRSSVREFLAQELMHALGVPTSRSLTLYRSQSESVLRPWYIEGSRSFNPDIMKPHLVAISTRVAPSFLRVGQLELFGRRARSNAHPEAQSELELIVKHLIARHYHEEVDPTLPFSEQVVQVAERFRGRLISLVTHWLRVGYCQGNFNSDNCAGGGYTLDYGPFGFCELFNPSFQPWTGGGEHFSFFNQPASAEVNYSMFVSSLRHLLTDEPEALARLNTLQLGFSEAMLSSLEAMWAQKLGLDEVASTTLNELFQLMLHSRVDYTKLFRVLCALPSEPAELEPCFYLPLTEELERRWRGWLQRWHTQLNALGDLEARAEAMRQVNPSVTWREWLVAPAYQQAEVGDFSLIHELQEVFKRPYEELSPALAARYDQLKPKALFNIGGISHYSCSS
jgi:uncharacterized protein YdiU (UPF0061 family)